MKRHAPTAEPEPFHRRVVRSGTGPQAAAGAPRDVLRSKVADDVSRFLAEGHAITLVPIGATAFDRAGRRSSMPFPARDWDD